MNQAAEFNSPKQPYKVGTVIVHGGAGSWRHLLKVTELDSEPGVLGNRLALSPLASWPPLDA